MAECKDGRKRVVVQEYSKNDGTKVTSYIRSCPNPKTTSQDEAMVCCVCGETHPPDEIRQFQAKGQIKNICHGCADIVHGLI